MSEEHPNEVRSSHGWGWWVVWAVFILFVVYPLSIGPIAKLDRALGNPAAFEDVAQFIYAPLIILYFKYPPVARFYDWYLEDVWGLP